ncbi:MFS transporter [Brachybacterium endophyticum]|uniref:MFS transporter n=2 Tax=Brachybacterium endophyticum TaxID=2182385 RepID=A0A2U2RK51_9MICO|nr:MFS transporter [Brachybacterium endophyticum]
MQDITGAYGVGAWADGLLTALPCLCFGAFGLLAVPMSRRIGLTGTIVVAFVLATIGLVLRPLSGSFGLFVLLSALALMGPSLVNVVTPAWVKRHGGRASVALMTLYSMLLAVGAATGPAIAVPLASGVHDWRDSLQTWAILAALPVVIGVLVLVRVGNDYPRAVPGADAAAATDPGAQPSAPPSSPAPAPQPPSASAGSELPDPAADLEATTARARARAAAREAARSVPLWRSPAAVFLTLMFGLQSMNAYTQFGMLPQILTDAGLSPGAAGATVSQVAAWGMVGGLVMPTIIARSNRLGIFALAFGLLTAAGYLGLILAPAASPVAWAALLGIGGFAFPTAIAMIPARTRDPAITARLSGIVQPVGYLLAGIGPLLMGALLQATASLTLVLWVLLVSALALGAAGWRASANRLVDDDLIEAVESRPPSGTDTRERD